MKSRREVIKSVACAGLASVIAGCGTFSRQDESFSFREDTTSFISCLKPPVDIVRAERVETQTQNIVDHLNSKISDHNFNQQTYIIDSNIIGSALSYNSDAGGEREYVKDVLIKIDNDEGTLLNHGEIVAIPHINPSWGYGRTFPLNLTSYETPNESNTDTENHHNQRKVFGSLIHALDISNSEWTTTGPNEFIPNWEVDGFTWHEIGHALGANHSDGSIAIGPNEKMHKITPMCMSYVISEDLEPDTRWPAGENVNFDEHVDNERLVINTQNAINQLTDVKREEECFTRAGDDSTVRPENYEFKYTKKSDNHTLDRYSEAALDEIQNWTKNYPQIENIEQVNKVSCTRPSRTQTGTPTRTQRGSTGCSDLCRTLLLLGSPPRAQSEYRITVSGEIKQIDGTLEGRSVSKDLSDSASGSVALGTVWDGADGFRFSGEITEISFSTSSGKPPDEVTILVDGTEWRG